MRRGKNKALGRVMAGYVLFAVCSILAITIYYLDSSLPYSPVYMLGIFGFILLLAETAGRAFWNRSRRTPTWPCTQNWRIGMC